MKQGSDAIRGTWRTGSAESVEFVGGGIAKSAEGQVFILVLNRHEFAFSADGIQALLETIQESGANGPTGWAEVSRDE